MTPAENTGAPACLCCGECCRGPQVVRLNGDDLDLLCRFTGLPDLPALVAAGFVEELWEADPGLWRPRLRFRRRPFAFCPFLENGLDDHGGSLGLCRLHPDHKPLVCHLAPLARTVEDDGVSWTESWELVPPVDGCPACGGWSGPAPADLAAGLPAGLRARLDREVEWMRERIARGSGDS